MVISHDPSSSEIGNPMNVIQPVNHDGLTSGKTEKLIKKNNK